MKITLSVLALSIIAFPALADVTVTDRAGATRVVTDAELACIGEAVSDPSAWVNSVIDVTHIDGKLARWCPVMESKKTQDGADYKDRLARDSAGI